MEVQNIQRSKNEEDDDEIGYLLLLLALWGLIGGLFLLFNTSLLLDFFRKEGRKPVIAQVSHLQSDVRRREVDQFAWYPAEHRERLRNEDSIFTSDDSTADIRFRDRSELVIEQNSLVMIKVDGKGRPIIMVTRGNVLVKPAPGQTMRVYVDGEKYEVTGDTDPVKVTRFESKRHPLIVAANPPPPPEPPKPPPPPKERYYPYRLLASKKEEEMGVTSIQAEKSYYDFNFTNPGPFEFTVRSSFIFTDASPYFLYEINGLAWSEKLFTSGKAPLTLDRFGISYLYNHSIPGGTDLQGQGIVVSKSNLDLKYKLIPGTWNRSFTLGVLGSYQTFSYRNLGASQYGLGVFWGQPLWKFYDDILNYVPWWRYPKWIEAEFKYYFASPQSEVHSNPSFQASVSGKLFFRPQFFLFGSLGYIRTDYVLMNNEEWRAEYEAYYGTGGLGVNF